MMINKVLTLTLNPALDKTVEIDSLETGGLNRINEGRIDAGGKGINVAKVLKNLVVDVRTTGIVAGHQGRRLLAYLDELGIESKFLEIEGETRTNLKVFDRSKSEITEFNEKGPFVSEDDLKRFDILLDRVLNDVEVFILSGSIPPGIKTDIYKKYIEKAKKRDIKTILDAEGELFRKGLEAKPYAVKPNIHELEQLFGRTYSRDEEVVEDIKKLIGGGVELVVVSMGGDGSIIANETETYRVRPFPIEVKSTVGSGDSMVAALSYSIMNNHEIEFIAKWITSAGTMTATKEGTQVCNFEDIRKNLDKVSIEKI
ncbi:fructose-1-phosphate kinase [Dethiosulfatibacter aminovorans DSM 17477]|uniref:Tagatose-6-phosphate kinase n=1 Tax=Dethiosulfatibacter aminovorans DSM 17477 TaxID=1121476 RepID=A0A1M6GD23_9FIRM|nr:1-phosphofructokinase [Dethiosulfatibacter aminovorans]SHJ07841.1 fructose-1-phosphate kinase [Dethiosulfatibacter aminovorans DSM 17477]